MEIFATEDPSIEQKAPDHSDGDEHAVKKDTLGILCNLERQSKPLSARKEVSADHKGNKLMALNLKC